MSTLIRAFVLIALTSLSANAEPGSRLDGPIKVIGGGIQNSSTQEILQLACVGDRITPDSIERKCNRLQFYALTDRSAELIGPVLNVGEGAPLSTQVTLQLATLDYLRKYKAHMGSIYPTSGLFESVYEKKTTIEAIQSRAKGPWQFKPFEKKENDYNAIKELILRNSPTQGDRASSSLCHYGKINFRVDESNILKHLFRLESFKNIDADEVLALTRLRLETLLQFRGFRADPKSTNYFEFKASDQVDPWLSQPIEGRFIETSARINLRYLYQESNHREVWQSLSRPFSSSSPIRETHPELLKIVGSEYFELQSSEWDFWGMSCEKALGALDPTEHRIGGKEKFKAAPVGAL